MDDGIIHFQSITAEEQWFAKNGAALCHALEAAKTEYHVCLPTLDSWLIDALQQAQSRHDYASPAQSMHIEDFVEAQYAVAVRSLTK